MDNRTAILVVSTVPSEERVKELTEYVGKTQFDGATCVSIVSDTLPDDQPSHLIDQLLAHQRENPGSVFIITKPVIVE